MFKFLSMLIPMVAVFFLFFGDRFSDFRLFGNSEKRGLFDLASILPKGMSLESEVSKYDKSFDYDNHEKHLDDSETNQEDTAEFVNSYYNLATDFYEYGWGESFHFAHKHVDEDFDDSIKRHEYKLADILGLEKGKRAVDCGCGVGGPARNIANYSGAFVDGITLNQYQVDRGTNHTKKRGLQDLVTLHQGDFTIMKPFEDGQFDGAYAIEATCHARKLEDVYGQIFRVLKPGAKFATYEWLSTPAFDKDNEEHRKIMAEIEYGNGLPPVRSLQECIKAGEAVGFRFVSEEDLAQDADNTDVWYKRLDMNWWSHYMTHASCFVMEKLGLAPIGTTDTSSMLLRAADGLVKGGKVNIFTPMHLVVFEKPAE